MKIRPFLCPVISSGDNPPPPRSSTSITIYEKSSALASVLPALTANHQRVPATHKSEALDIDHSCQVHGKSFADYSSAWSLNLEKTLSTQSGHMNLRSCVDPSFVTFSPSRFFRFASSRFQNITPLFLLMANLKFSRERLAHAFFDSPILNVELHTWHEPSASFSISARLSLVIGR